MPSGAACASVLNNIHKYLICHSLYSLWHVEDTWSLKLPTHCSLSENHWLMPLRKDLSSKLHFSWYWLSTRSSRLGKKWIPDQRLLDKFKIWVQWQKFILSSWFLLLKASAGEAEKNLACWLSVWNECKDSSSEYSSLWNWASPDCHCV